MWCQFRQKTCPFRWNCTHRQKKNKTNKTIISVFVSGRSPHTLLHCQNKCMFLQTTDVLNIWYVEILYFLMLQFSILCCDFTTIVWIGLDLNARNAPDVLIKIFTAMAEKSPHILFKILVPQQVTCSHFSSSHKGILSCALQDSPCALLASPADVFLPWRTTIPPEMATKCPSGQLKYLGLLVKVAMDKRFLFGSCLSSVTLPSHPNLKVTNIHDRKNSTCKALFWVVTRAG